MASIHISQQQHISAESALVYSVLTDPQQLTSWISGLRKVNILKEENSLVGSRTELTILRNGRTMTFVQTVLAAEANQLLQVKLEHKDMSIIAEYSLREENDTTRLFFEERITLRSTMLKFAKRLVESMENDTQVKTLQQLAAYIESKSHAV